MSTIKTVQPLIGSYDIQSDNQHIGHADTRFGFLLVMSEGPEAKEIVAFILETVENLRPQKGKVNRKKIMRDVVLAAGEDINVAALLISPQAAVLTRTGSCQCYQTRFGRKVFETSEEMLESHVLPYEREDRFILCADSLWSDIEEKDFFKALRKDYDIEDEELTYAIIETETDSKIGTTMTRKSRRLLIIIILLLLVSVGLNVWLMSGNGLPCCQTTANDSIAKVDTTKKDTIKPVVTDSTAVVTDTTANAAAATTNATSTSTTSSSSGRKGRSYTNYAGSYDYTPAPANETETYSPPPASDPEPEQKAGGHSEEVELLNTLAAEIINNPTKFRTDLTNLKRKLNKDETKAAFEILKTVDVNGSPMDTQKKIKDVINALK